MDDSNASSPLRGFANVPVEIIVSVGKARPLVGELLKLNESSVLKLDRRVEDPVELYVGDRLIARGELHQIDDGTDDGLAVRLTEIIGGTAP